MKKVNTTKKCEGRVRIYQASQTVGEEYQRVHLCDVHAKEAGYDPNHSLGATGDMGLLVRCAEDDPLR